MASTTPASSASERVRISCPGCGRHDWVTWPHGQATLQWTCFNCGKTSTLKAGSAH
jgi:ribosomal protein S27E